MHTSLERRGQIDLPGRQEGSDALDIWQKLRHSVIGKHVGIKTGAYWNYSREWGEIIIFLRAQDSREERREERRRMEEALQQEYASRRVRRCG